MSEFYTEADYENSINEKIALELVRTVKAVYLRQFEELKAELEEKWLG